MEDRSHALIAVVFLAVFGVGAALVAWWMLSPGVVRLPYQLESQASVGGLGPGSPVKFKGVLVGKVDSIRLDQKTHRSVEVMIAVDKNFPLPQGSYATISSNGFIGNEFVDLHLGSGSAVIHTSAKNPARLELKPAGLSELMNQAQGVIGDVHKTLASAQELLSPENRKKISATLSSIQQASAQLVDLERAAQPSVRELPALVVQTKDTLATARRLVANADALVARARVPMAAVGQAASSTAALTAQLNQQSAPQLNALLVRLRALSAQLEALSAQLRQTPQSLILGPAKARPGPGESPPGGNPGG